MKESLLYDAEVLWEYLRLHEQPGPADVLLVLGSMDDRVATYAAELTKKWQYNVVVFSGGTAHATDLLRTTWKEPEAEHFYKIFTRAGGIAQHVLLETASQNTGENAKLTYELLKRSGISMPKIMHVVTKPYMLRRARATFEKQWPSKQTHFCVTGPDYTFMAYVHDRALEETVLNMMVGDMQRIVEYPKRGLQTTQQVPSGVLESWTRLVENGYTKHLI